MLTGEWSLEVFFFFFSSRRRHTRLQGDWSSDVCSSDDQNILALRRQLKRRLGFSGAAKRESEHTRRFAAGDDSLHAGAGVVMLLVFLRRRLVRREIPVPKVERELAALAQLHRPTRKPVAALLRVGEIVPDALDGAGQRAHEAHLRWAGELAVYIVCFHDEVLFFRFCSFDSSSARNSHSRASSRCDQTDRVFSSQASRSPKPSGLRACTRDWPSARTVTSPASCSTFRCWEIAGALMSNSSTSSPAVRSRTASSSTIRRRFGSAMARRLCMPALFK